MSLLLLLFAVPSYAKLVSEPCKSVDIWNTPWLPLDVCTNSYSEAYRGSYSEKFTCDQDKGWINTTFYWGYDCLSLTGEPAFSIKTLDKHEEWCYNWTSYNYTHLVLHTDCITNLYEYEFNCDESLPVCPAALYTTYTILDDVETEDCSTSEEETNWKTQTMVVDECECYNYSNTGWMYTECYQSFCNESGIYYLWISTEDIVEYQALCDIDWDRLNENITDIYTIPIIEGGCDENNQYIHIECPADDKCVLCYCMMGYIVAIVMLFVVECDYA